MAALQQHISDETLDGKSEEDCVAPALASPFASSPVINGSSNSGAGSRDSVWPSKQRSVRVALGKRGFTRCRQRCFVAVFILT